MKRYEKLGIDLTTKEGYLKAVNLSCTEIGNKFDKSDCGERTCDECLAERLFEEVHEPTLSNNYCAYCEDWVSRTSCISCIHGRNFRGREMIEVENVRGIISL